MAFTGTKVNGQTYDFSSVQVKLGDVGVAINIEEINYSDGLEPGERRGTAPYVTETTRGEYSAEGDMTLSKEDSSILIKAFGPGFMEKKFQIVVTYADDGSPTIVDTLNKVRISGNDQGASRGDPLNTKHSLHIQDPILWDGVPGVRLQQGAT